MNVVLDRSTGDAIEQVGLASENGAIDGANFGDSVGGGISSLLVGEAAAQALGLHGLGGQLVTTVAGSITTRLVNNLGNLVIPPGEGLGVDSLDVLFAGFESAEFGANLVANIGAVFGSFLGGQVVHPETQAGGIGASIGSTLGGIIGNAVVPIIGGFIGRRRSLRCGRRSAPLSHNFFSAKMQRRLVNPRAHVKVS
jgi:hypothetical protein